MARTTPASTTEPLASAQTPVIPEVKEAAPSLAATPDLKKPEEPTPSDPLPGAETLGPLTGVAPQPEPEPEPEPAAVQQDSMLTIYPLRSYLDGKDIKRAGGEGYKSPKHDAVLLIAKGLATQTDPKG